MKNTPTHNYKNSNTYGTHLYRTLPTECMNNKQIQRDLTVTCEEMSLEDAKAAGAHGVFDSKYGEKVKVYFYYELYATAIYSLIVSCPLQIITFINWVCPHFPSFCSPISALLF